MLMLIPTNININKKNHQMYKKIIDEGSKSHPANQSINTGISALWMVMFVKRLYSLVVQHLL
jgi:hypothetical protein